MQRMRRPPSALPGPCAARSRWLAIGAFAGALCGAVASPEVVDPLRGYYQFVHAMSIGDPWHALAQFADDAVVVAAPDCPPDDPCAGTAAIAARLLPALHDRRLPLPLHDQRFDGQALHTRGDHVPGRRGGWSIALAGGRITRMCFVDAAGAAGDLPPSKG